MLLFVYVQKTIKIFYYFITVGRCNNNKFINGVSIISYSKLLTSRTYFVPWVGHCCKMTNWEIIG